MIRTCPRPRRAWAAPAALALLTSLATGSPATAQGPYQIEDLGPVGPRGPSNAGGVVFIDSAANALTFRRDGRSVPLATLPPFDWSSTTMSSFAPPLISRGGTVAFSTVTTQYDANFNATSTTNTTLVAGGTTTALGAIAPPGLPPGAFSMLSAVNDPGELAGVGYGPAPAPIDDPEPVPAFLEPVGFLSTDRFGPRQTYSLGPLVPVALNNQGIVAGVIPTGTVHVPDRGYGAYDRPVGHAAIGGLLDGQPWHADLGTLGGVDSRAMAINDAGQVAGASQIVTDTVPIPPDISIDDPFFLTPEDVYHAFVTKDGQMIDLGTLSPYDYSSEALALNAAGDVVGASYHFGGYNVMGFPGSHAFLYRDGVMTDLNDLLPAGSPWELASAIGINDAGQILGIGMYMDPNLDPSDPFSGFPTQRAFLLSPRAVPEPSSLVLLATAGLVLAIRRHRRRAPARG